MKYILAWLLLIASPLHAQEFLARVVSVSDGDTLTVESAERGRVKIRLNGIDAPELAQAHGGESKRLLAALCNGKDVIVTPRTTDRYGRTVADVSTLNGVSLNSQMVVDGYAWWFRKYAPHDRELSRLESTARAAKKGLWASLAPITPWDWREGIGLTGFIGNRRSHLYHRPHCQAASKISDKNRVAFATEAEAMATGFRAAKDCD